VRVVTSSIGQQRRHVSKSSTQRQLKPASAIDSLSMWKQQL